MSFSDLAPPTPGEVAALRGELKRHALWAATAGREGERLVVSEMPFANLGFGLAGRNLNGIELWACDLSGLDLSGLDASGGRFTELCMRDCDLSESILVKTDFSRANLAGARFPRANLRRAVFDGACLVAADLSETDLRGASFAGCDLSRTVLRRADLRGATGFDLAHTEAVDTGSSTLLSGESARQWLMEAAARPADASSDGTRFGRVASRST